MKANNPLNEPVDTALPLFGDPRREFDYLSAMGHCYPIDGGLEAEEESSLSLASAMQEWGQLAIRDHLWRRRGGWA